MSDNWWDAAPLANQDTRVGYIPGTPKAKDPLDVEGKTLSNRKAELDIAKAEREALTTGGGNGEQGTAAGFYQRALYANRKYGPGVAPRDALTQGVVDILPTSVANSMTGNERQQAEAYQRDFVAATLRKESGAAISEGEYKNQFVRYFPQPGDSPDTIRVKARLRDTAIQSLRNQAGPAADAADKSVQQMLAGDNGATETQRGFGLHSEEKKNELTPEQQLRDKAFLATNPSHEQYVAFLAELTGNPVDPTGAAKRLDASKAGGTYSGEVVDPRVQQKVDQFMQQAGGAGAAFTAGAADTAGLGLADEFGAGLSALGQSLSGNGSLSDNYNVDLQANRGYQQALQQQNGLPYLGGQVLGGALLPVGEVTGPADLAKAGAAYGGAYGAGSGDDLASRLTGGFTGAAAGGAVGYALPKLGSMLRRAPQDVPPLVDPVTGALNQPLEAMSPGNRVVAAQQFGIDLPMDAAGGRTAARIGKGLDILPGSTGVMEDVRRGTEQQVAGAADKVADQFGSSRTLNEAGSELQRGANERIDRAKAVISKAYNAIPISDTAPASNSNTVATLQQLTGRFQSNPDLADAVKDPRLIRYLNAIEKGGLSWKDTKDFRSLIGEKIGDMRFGEGHSISDLRALYGALSEDMRTTASTQGPMAIRAFERANSLNRQNEEMVQGALTRILGKGGELAPEKAAAAVQAMTKGGKATGDLRTLAQIRAATSKSGAWDEVAATLIRLGGQPANSQGRDFNPQTFVQWYADMSEPARNLLFKPELRQSLDNFVAVNQRLMKVDALRNSSNTAGSMTAAGTVGVMGLAMIHPKAAVLLGAEMGGNYLMAKLWTSPGFVKWATGFSRAATPAAAKAQVGRLAKLAATNPELRAPLVSLQQKLLSGANDNAMLGAAASQPNSEEQ